MTGSPHPPMSGRTPTLRQYRQLLVLGSGGAGLSWPDRKLKPYLRWGWVERDEDHQGLWHWVRITGEGFRALARATDRYGLPGFEQTRLLMSDPVKAADAAKWKQP